MLIDDEREQCLSNFALGCIITGVFITLLGIMYPLEPFYLDFNLSARENEARELAFQHTKNILYIISATGMSTMLFGGMISSFLVCRMILMEEYENRSRPLRGLYHSHQHYDQFVSMPAYPGKAMGVPTAISDAEKSRPSVSLQTESSQFSENPSSEADALSQSARQDYGSTSKY